jgi:hypothetical protein
LRRELDRYLDVGNDEFVLEAAAFERHAQAATHGRPHAVRGDDPVGVDLVDAVGGLDVETHGIGGLRDPDDAIQPPQLDTLQLPAAFGQERLDIVLR